MQHAIERRHAGAPRIAFDEKVDVGGDETLPPFEASAVDVSREGLHLMSPFLPELGQPLSCRFTAGDAEVICEGTVVWRQESSGAGGHEFGLRFTALDSESARALSDLMVSSPPSAGPATRESASDEMSSRGARIRLHIDGLGAPMRARVRDANAQCVQAQSELGFLQIGKEIELEDAVTGQKRHVRIDQVDVELDPTTQVPQLVVGLAYLARSARHEAPVPAPAFAPDTERAQPDTEISAPVVGDVAPVVASVQPELEIDPEIAEESARIKGQLAGAFAKITPAVMASSQKAYLAMRTLWSKRKSAAEAAPVRRTTAPPPGGGVASKARRVTRGPNSLSTQEASSELDATPKAKAVAFAKTHKRKLAAGGALAAAAMLAGLALGQPSDDKPLASLPPATSAAAVAEPVQVAPVQVAPVAAAPAAAAMNPADLPVETASLGNAGVVEDDLEGGERVAVTPRPVRAARPFGRGKIENGKAFRLKMDGPIENIQGAQLPEGFLVTMPDRRSLEGAASLFKSDPRVLKAKVDNTSHGAELELTFKDGTPSYVVRARGETLEIVLSRPQAGDESRTTAKSDSKKSDKVEAKNGRDNKKTKKSDAKGRKKDNGIERASVKSASRKRSR